MELVFLLLGGVAGYCTYLTRKNEKTVKEIHNQLEQKGLVKKRAK